MTYDRLNLAAQQPDVGKRIDWLQRRDNFRPQPYQQLAKVLRLQGHTDAARAIAIAGQDEIKIADWVFSAWHCFWGRCFGYGLSPGRAAWTLLGCLLIGWLGTWLANDQAKVMILSTTNVTGWASARKEGAQPVFRALAPGVGDVELPCGNQINSFFYAVDVMLPIVPLHQESKCEVSTEVALHPGLWLGLEGWRIGKSIFSIIGKLITTLALITFSGILRPRDQE